MLKQACAGMYAPAQACFVMITLQDKCWAIRGIISLLDDMMMDGGFLCFSAASTQSTTFKAKLFRGFADPSRLSILEALRDNPLTVTEIIEATGLSQSNVSNHLSCLYGCGLVARDQKGRYVEYRLSDPRVLALLSTAEELLADVARGVYECTRYENDPLD
jgi:ArsR family transcriptional regulator, cadmium/lead-responsive transcriptional repressor